ncbi:SixA phosphatase family protein [Pengzhenrongella phosphoraccumulans]|uniref:SixA phosphatase family protein n=1 Tax=Pengzhenrongella phosphoraccumulans TaxID=3114394 RepID=UPI00388F1BBC
MTPTADAPRRLVLLRHAKAEHSGREVDEKRPLALAGRRQCAQIGAALTARDLVPELVLCSSAVRTRQTWDLVRTGLGGASPEVEFSGVLYDAGVSEVLALVQQVPDEVRTVLVVGHEPTMSAVAATLASSASDKAAVAHVRAGTSTGTFSVLDVAGPWSGLARGAARLHTVVAPTH